MSQHRRQAWQRRRLARWSSVEAHDSCPFKRASRWSVQSFLPDCNGVGLSGKCFCSPEAPVAAAGETAEHGTPLPLCALDLVLPSAARRFVGVATGASPGKRRSREPLTQGSRSAVKARLFEPFPWPSEASCQCCSRTRAPGIRSPRDGLRRVLARRGALTRNDQEPYERRFVPARAPGGARSRTEVRSGKH